MRAIDADTLLPKLYFINEAENQIYGKESWRFAAKCIDEVKDAPTIEPEREEQRWILCSERLPEREDESIMRGYYLTTNAYGSVCITRYEFETQSFGHSGWGSDIQIIAWKPLPEPYKEEDDDE